MSEQYSVDREGLAERVDDLAAFEAHAEETIKEAEQLAKAFEQLWVSTAAEEHQKAHAEWAKGAQEMRDALAEIRQAAANAHANYTSATAVNTGFWK